MTLLAYVTVGSNWTPRPVCGAAVGKELKYSSLKPSVNNKPL